MHLQVSKLKPNPSGKDRNRQGSPSPAQLGAEWVDLRNTGREAISLAGVELYHLAYNRASGKAEWQKITGFRGTLGVGHVLRVHSGRSRPLTVLRPEDLTGAKFHCFTGRDAFVWNNVEGDSAGLWRPKERVWIDKAFYDPHPPEGAVLIRSGNKLVPAGVAAARL